MNVANYEESNKLLNTQFTFSNMNNEINTKIDYFQSWMNKYHDDLIDDIMPFWLNNGIDLQNGGIYTCLDRDGTLIDSTKSVWFQGRFAFTCAFAYNNVEKRSEWLAASKMVTTQHPSNSSKLFIQNTFPSKYLDYFLCISLIISIFTV